MFVLFFSSLCSCKRLQILSCVFPFSLFHQRSTESCCKTHFHFSSHTSLLACTVSLCIRHFLGKKPKWQEPKIIISGSCNRSEDCSPQLLFLLPHKLSEPLYPDSSLTHSSHVLTRFLWIILEVFVSKKIIYGLSATVAITSGASTNHKFVKCDWFQKPYLLENEINMWWVIRKLKTIYFTLYKPYCSIFMKQLMYMQDKSHPISPSNLLPNLGNDMSWYIHVFQITEPTKLVTYS